MKKWLALLLKIAVSAALIWYLISNIDVDAAKNRIAQVDLMLLLLATGILLFQIVIGGLRWSAVLKAIRVPLGFWETFRLFYIGIFFNQALPGGTGGDAMRVYMVYKAGLGLRGALNGVILERVATVLALVILVLVTQPFFLSNLDAASRAWVVPAIAVVSIGAFSGVALICVLDRLPEKFRQWRVVRGLGNLASDARIVFLNPINAVRVLGWSITGHVNISLSVFVLALGLNLEITALDSIVLMPPVLLVMTLPISIGGWGVRENAMVVAFGMVAVSAEAATVLGLLLGLVGLATAIPGGLLWMVRRDRGAATMSEAEAELAAASNAEKS